VAAVFGDRAGIRNGPGRGAAEYVWLDDMPVALLDISGATVTTDYIHTGQIDEPGSGAAGRGGIASGGDLRGSAARAIRLGGGGGLHGAPA